MGGGGVRSSSPRWRGDGRFGRNDYTTALDDPLPIDLSSLASLTFGWSHSQCNLHFDTAADT